MSRLKQILQTCLLIPLVLVVVFGAILCAFVARVTADKDWPP